MKFTKLRLLGFKSFVEPMDFIIEPGLTGVVGPNGCGKSNLVEALRWVMGENSYKNMRASGMDDVIFAGSTHRPARNTAEVTLYLDNAERTAPAGFNDSDELEVSRRIERESGSNYKINGKDVRARDVQLLFADASTGARSPSLVGQGRIGEIISQKPTQRRGLLEEAAGISGLHSRRHEAELRLKAAETNLERLEDIMAQITSQLDGLKRQARQASRYRNLSAEIRKMDATLFYLRWQETKAKEEEARGGLRKADLAVAEASTHQSEAARNEAVASHALPDLRDDLASKSATLQRLTLASKELDQSEARIKEKLADLDRRIEQLKADRLREQNLVDENASILKQLDEEEAALKLEEESAESTAKDAASALARLEEDLQLAESRATELAAKLAESEGTERQMKQAAEAANHRKARLTQQRQANAQDLQKVSDSLARDAGLEEKRQDIEARKTALSGAEEQAEGASAKVAEAREAETLARRARADAEGKFNRLETEAKTLAKVVNAGRDERFPPILDSLKVETGFETALGAALGDDLDAPLNAEAGIHWGDTKPDAADASLPHDLPMLATYVKGPERLVRRLRQIGLVSQAHGKGLQQQLAVGQRLVSREGDLWRWDGLVIKAGAPTPAAQRLEQRNRLEELEAKVDNAKGDLNHARAVFNEKREEVGHLVSAEQRARSHWREQQKILSQLRDALAKAERDANQLIARKTALEETGKRLAQEESEAQIALQEAQDQLAALPDLSELKLVRDEARLELGGKRAKVSEARAFAQGLKREGELRQRRLEAIARERTSWITRAANADNQIAVLDGRMAQTEEERRSLQDAPDTILEQRRALLGEIGKAEEAQKTASDQLAVAERASMEADLAAKKALEILSDRRGEKIRAEERLTSMIDRRLDMERQIVDALDCSPAATFDLAQLKQGAPLPAIASIEGKLERLKAERERLGGVNLRADEEATEISDQLTKMETERDDLIEAIKKLRTGIFNLNKEARARLLASFDVVNDHFKTLFSKLFGGGQAELQLTEAEDPLQAGLDIIARPPGKKPQTMTLLSGGEQALTAMALIFAVFLTNPAPICVLDEVDAPLDDANVERFMTLLEEMRKLTNTRFVTITHNPITMARMDRLFGVTMAERGISQLVSVSLEVAEEMIHEEDKKAVSSIPPGHPLV
ncbi:MAG: AAA family ATPase [Cohaesibacter sp.]|jgi:chromosome segregation protein|nr:AAA family ATPase [Cohaesibacter sp.]